jgi:Bacterial pre-peptidase C-terminal domain
MSCIPRYRPTKAGRRAQIPRLECLEFRRVLSAANLPPGITAVQLEPSSGGANQELVISFDQADVDASTSAFSVPFATLINDFDANTDFQLDGPTGMVFGFTDPPAVENVVQNGNSTDVIIPINASLPAGTYQVSLNGGTNLDIALSLVDSSASNPFWTSLAASPAPVTIANLTVQPIVGSTLGQATNLGLIGPTVQNVLGSLNPGNVPAPVDLYEITLAPGQIWDLGVSISTQSINSSLLTGLTLFGPSGNVLAQSSSGQGLFNDPDDPFIFAGLSPTPQADTYYIGVSGYGNLAYGNQGYNPVTGIPGTKGIMQPAGLFELSVIAQPHDQATQLVGFSLSHEDPLDSSPTSMTLTFSAPIDVTSLFVPDQQETAIEVVDSSGRIWPVTAETYQTSDAQLTLIFDEPLPPGQYSLIVPATGGLTDLAGEPVSAQGEPAGVLATWTVAGQGAPENPNDLGVLWPSTADMVWPTANGSFSETTTLAPGQSATYRWVAIAPGTYKLQTQVVGSSIEVVNSSGSRATVLDMGSTNALNNYLMTLSAGVYELRLTNVGSQPADVRWLLKIETLDWEKIMNNGVSQSSALSLMTFMPPPPSTSASTETGFLSIPPSGTGAVFDSSSGPVPSSLLVTLNTAPAGLPSWNGQAAAAAGLLAELGNGGESGGGAGQALIAGIRPSSESADEASDDVLGVTQQPAKDLVGEPGPIGSTTETVSLQRGFDPAGVRADIQALARTEWASRIGSVIHGWFIPSRSDASPRTAEAELMPPSAKIAHQAARFVKDPANPWRNRQLISMLRSEIGATASLIMIGAVAYRLRHPIRVWCGDKAQLTGPGNSSRARALPGPHRISKLSRLKTHVRRP